MSATTRDPPRNSQLLSATHETSGGAMPGGVLRTDLTFSLARLEEAERQVQKMLDLGGREVKNARGEELETDQKRLEISTRERIKSEHARAFSELQARYEKRIASLEKSAAADVARLQELIQTQKSLETTSRELAEFKQAKSMGALEARYQQEVLAIQKVAAEKIALAEEAQGSYERLDGSALECLKAEHARVLVELPAHYEKEIARVSELGESRQLTAIKQLQGHHEQVMAVLQQATEERIALAEANQLNAIKQLQGHYEQEMAALERAALAKVTQAEAARERLEGEHARVLVELPAHYEKEVARVQEQGESRQLNAVKQLQGHYEQEMAALRRTALENVAQAEAARERMEGDHARVVTELHAWHESRLLSVRQTAETDRQKAINDLQVRHEQEMATTRAMLENELVAVQEMAAAKMNHLSLELSSTLEAMEMLRQENKTLSLRPRAEEFETLRELNATLISVVATLKVDQGASLLAVQQELKKY